MELVISSIMQMPSNMAEYEAFKRKFLLEYKSHYSPLKVYKQLYLLEMLITELMEDKEINEVNNYFVNKVDNKVFEFVGSKWIKEDNKVKLLVIYK